MHFFRALTLALPGATGLAGCTQDALAIGAPVGAASGGVGGLIDDRVTRDKK